MAMDFADIDSVGCRGFGPTAAMVLNTVAKHDCIGRGLEVALNQRDPELCVCVVTNEELGKALDVSWTLAAVGNLRGICYRYGIFSSQELRKAG